MAARLASYRLSVRTLHRAREGARCRRLAHSPSGAHATAGVHHTRRVLWRIVLLAGTACAILGPVTNQRWVYADSPQSPAERLDYVEEEPDESEDDELEEEPLSDGRWPIAFDFAAVRGRISDFLMELSRGPGSLYSEIVNTPPDPTVHPEVEWDAEVRLGEDLCIAERAFIGERLRAMRKPFAALMGVDEREVDERDIPVVAIAGSGGGYRAMLNTIGSLCGAEASGIFDCVAYTAGVSGSCWALGVMHSGVAGSSSAFVAAQHLKDRIQTSYLDMVTLDALVTPPINKSSHSILTKSILTLPVKYSLLRKAAGENGVVSLVDVYGTLLGSRILVPSDVRTLDPQHLSLHLMRKAIDRGQLPLPIFTAIQHAIAPVAIQAMRDLQSEKSRSVDPARADALEKAQSYVSDTASRFFWYEFTPYEIGCDEIGAWIPSWAFGREFFNGESLERRLYFKEIQPTLELFPPQLYHWLLELVTENERDLGLIHPVLPDQVPNFLKGLNGQLRPGSPPDLADRTYMTFMDAGAELNIPYYPLLRRNVDCIIALDASADSQDLWFTRAEGQPVCHLLAVEWARALRLSPAPELAVKRGLRTWPRGASWPAEVHPAHAHRPGADGTGDTEARAAIRKFAESQESALAEQTHRQDSTGEHGLPQRGEEAAPRRGSFASCEVWIGSSESNASDSARLDDLDEAALLRRDGIGIVYIPLAANEARVPGFDPSSVSTWRREVTAAESQALLDVAEANFAGSRAKIVRLLRAIWLRKKRDRARAEWRDRLLRLRPDMLHNSDF
ncbi:hypothetical protein PHLGIDRAFT_114837 [Phlebiopsis gigantea 11061_1 CR5-6]|uniref:Lysophospholipase n=1 Tax=Phlebiopsis gigantea (strain 11061_1 CR5-6) TaxID=745531 RepID=A0A0C3SCS4_PHLG1|nr:hypothetical protein PHLGIDRAFT_114837 [Phlebiopsis gigantea 11061_1 CR5-6]